jgi:hypothetical protein
VKTAFESVRADWLRQTGVSPETEAAWHTLEADAVASGQQQAASCPGGDAWHTEDPAHLARQYVLCGESGRTCRYAIDARGQRAHRTGLGVPRLERGA